MRVFLTHNPEDLRAYYSSALVELERVADVVRNPSDRDLATPELIEAAAGCEVIISHRATAGEAELFEQLDGLVAFLRCAVDISTIDVDAASANGVLVGRADKSFIPSTAELALGLLIAVARHVASSTCDYRSGRPEQQRTGRQLRGMTAGIIGFGSIGAYLGELLHALGLHMLITDPHVDSVPDHAQRLELEELLGRADVVFPLAPGEPATENLVGAGELARMRRGAILINVSRGELLDEAAVAAALDSGHLGGVGLDVGRAPDQRPSPLLAGRDDVVATPHLGGLTPENADAQAMSSVEQVTAMLAGELPPRAVNPDRASRLRGWWER